MPFLAAFAAAMTLMSPVASASTFTPGLSITASGATTIGLQIFANSNLTGGSNPTGAITFRLFGPGDTSCSSPIFTSTMPVAGQSMNSDHYTTKSSGTYRWTSYYGGDANNAPAGPTSCSDPNASVIVGGAYTGISVTSPASTGTIHASVALGGGSNPTGTITAYLSAPGDSFCSQTIFTSTMTVQGNGTYTSALYHPTATGTYRWRATYTGDTNNQADPMTSCLDQNDTVDVTSAYQPPAAAASPSPATFPAQVAASGTASTTVTLTNSGGDNLAVSGVTTSGPNGGDFSIISDNCTGATVAPAAGCTVGVTFAPSATGNRSAAIAFADNAAGSPQTVAVSGAGTPDQGLFINPLDGQTGVDTTRVVRWATSAAGQGYLLTIGTTPNGSDLVRSAVLAANRSSYSIPALPTGRALYATLLTETDGSWTRSQTISFTAAPGKATLTNPTSGQATVPASAMFNWSTIPQGQGYHLLVGTKANGNDLVNSGSLPSTQASYQASGLPGGKTLYATIYTETNGNWSRYQTVTFTTK